MRKMGVDQVVGNKFKAKEFTHFVIGGVESFKFFSGGGAWMMKYKHQHQTPTDILTHLQLNPPLPPMWTLMGPF